MPFSAIQMLPDPFALAFVMMGRWTPSGSWPSTRCSAFDTSVDARSISRPASNWMLMKLIPNALVDSRLWMSSTVFSTCSSGSVTMASTVSGLAPA